MAVDTPSLNGAKLTITDLGPNAKFDKFVLQPLSVTHLRISKHKVFAGNVEIATINTIRPNVGGTKGIPLEIIFNDKATAAHVQDLLRGLAFGSDIPPTAGTETHTLTVQLTNVGAQPANGTSPAVPGVDSNLAEQKIILVKSFVPGK